MDKRDLSRWFIAVIAATFSAIIAGCQAGQDQASAMRALPQNGAIDVGAAIGELGAEPAPDGIEPQVWERLTSGLAAILGERILSGKLTSTPPAGESGAAELSYIEGTSALNWLYVNPGDYNQNGEVGISDLTPLGLHFGEESPAGAGQPFPPLSEGAAIDGNKNGVIDIGDITPIGANFGCVVEGYRIYMAQDEAAVPEDPDLPNGLGTAWIDTAIIESANYRLGRLEFSRQVVPTKVEQYYWIRPFHGDLAGAASNAVLVIQPPNQPPEAALGVSGNQQTLAHIRWNAAGSHDPDGMIVSYEWDFDGDGMFEHKTKEPAVEFYYYDPGTYSCTVRVVDDQSLSDTSSRSVTVTEGAKWHTTLVDSQVNPPGMIGASYAIDQVQLIEVEGLPSIVYTRVLDEYDPVLETWYETIYLHAEDEHGETWDAPQRLPCETKYDPGGNEYAALVYSFVVDGLPALLSESLAEITSPSEEIRYEYWQSYSRATDATGTSWTDGVVLSYRIEMEHGWEGTRLDGFCLEIDSAPMLFGEGKSAEYGSQLAYIRAQDSSGSTWPVDLSYSEFPASLGPSAATLIDGNIAYVANPALEDILYYRNLSSTEIEWAEPVRIDNLEQAYRPRLLNAGGFPIVVYFDETLSALKCRRAVNVEGAAWHEPVILTDAVEASRYITAMIDGRTAVLFVDRIDGEVKLIAANDSTGFFWGFPSPAPDIYHGDLLNYGLFREIAGAPVLTVTDEFPVGEGEWETRLIHISYY